jgi:hypothetical protein
MCERRSIGICCHDPPHDEAVDPPLRLFHTVSEGEFCELHAEGSRNFANIESLERASVHSWNGLRVSLRRSAASEAAKRSSSSTAT